MGHFKTIQALAFRNLFETLKDVVTDLNIIFTPTGISISAFDSAKVSFTIVDLPSENFEEYTFKNRISAGVNVSNTLKLLKTITSNDILEINVDNPEIMTISISGSGKQSSVIQLKLLDMNEEEFEPDPDAIKVYVQTTLVSQDFQRLIRDMSNIAKEINITRHDTDLAFEAEGDFANQKTSITCSEKYQGKESGLYCLKYLSIFSKASSLCPNLQLIQGAGPLCLRYRVSNLGDVSFYLAEKV